MKGEYMQECNRTACQQPPAEYYNHSTRQYYCAACANAINQMNRADAMRLFGHDLCTKGQPAMTDKQQQEAEERYPLAERRINDDAIDRAMTVVQQAAYISAAAPREAVIAQLTRERDEYYDELLKLRQKVAGFEQRLSECWDEAVGNTFKNTSVETWKPIIVDLEKVSAAKALFISNQLNKTND